MRRASSDAAMAEGLEYVEKAEAAPAARQRAGAFVAAIANFYCHGRNFGFCCLKLGCLAAS